MPSQHTLTVALTAQLREFIVAQIATGRFRTASEVVRAALRGLERDEPAGITIGTKAGPRQTARARTP